MLFTMEALRGIEAGEVTVAFRLWARPTVRTGGPLKTAVGLLAIDAIDKIDAAEITARDVRAAGFGDFESLIASLGKRPGTLYRIRFHLAGEDPRIALRERAAMNDAEWAALQKRLERLDRAAEEPWTRRVLEVIEQHPARRAGDLAALLQVEKEPFKINVRKLKNLGLTESLEIGYRLSPRGAAVLNRVRS